MLLPVLRALREANPTMFLVGAAPTGTCELLSGCCIADDTISLGIIRSPAGGASSNTAKRLWTMVRRSRQYVFDVVLDFSPRFETQVLSRLVLRAPVFSPARFPRVFGRLLELGGVARSAQPVRSVYNNVLQQIGVEMRDTRFAIDASPEEDERFEKRLANSGSRGGELIALLYSSNRSDARGWPVVAFGEIGTRLVNNFEARIIICDEPSDNAFTRSVIPWLPRSAIRLAQPRALELIAAIARASIVITDEPAIAQIASELSTPAIEVADALTAQAQPSAAHRIACASSRARVSIDQVFEIASEMIQEHRSTSLFQRS